MKTPTLRRFQPQVYIQNILKQLGMLANITLSGEECERKETDTLESTRQQSHGLL